MKQRNINRLEQMEAIKTALNPPKGRRVLIFECGAYTNTRGEPEAPPAMGESCIVFGSEDCRLRGRHEAKK